MGVCVCTDVAAVVVVGAGCRTAVASAVAMAVADLGARTCARSLRSVCVCVCNPPLLCRCATGRARRVTDERETVEKYP